MSITITLGDVPIYLRSSDFYKNLDKSKYQSFKVPYCKRNLKIKNVQDLKKLLQTIDFWGLPVPKEIYKFILKNQALDYTQLNNFTPELIFLSKISTISLTETETEMKVSTETELLNSVNLAISQATTHGYLNCIKILHECGYKWDINSCRIAALNGHLDCLQYLHENGCPWEKHTCVAAAYGGHLDCLMYAHKNGCPLVDYICEISAENGHLNCLQYAHENGCLLNKNTCISAAKNGHINCLNYTRDNGCRCLHV